MSSRYPFPFSDESEKAMLGFTREASRRFQEFRKAYVNPENEQSFLHGTVTCLISSDHSFLENGFRGGG